MTNFYKKIELDDYIYRLHHSLQNKRIPSSIAAGLPYHEAKRQYINVKVNEWIEEKKQAYYMEQRRLQKQCFFNADNPSPLLSSITKLSRDSFYSPLFNTLDEANHNNDTALTHPLDNQKNIDKEENSDFPPDFVKKTFSPSYESHKENSLSQIYENLNNNEEKDEYIDLNTLSRRKKTITSETSLLDVSEPKDFPNSFISSFQEGRESSLELYITPSETSEKKNIDSIPAISESISLKENNDKLLSSEDGFNISNIEKAWEKTTVSLGSPKLIPIPTPIPSENRQDSSIGSSYPIPDIEHEHILSSGSNIWLNKQKNSSKKPQKTIETFEKLPNDTKDLKENDKADSPTTKAIKESLKQLHLTVSQLSFHKDDVTIFSYSSEETLNQALNILQSKNYLNPFSSFVSQNDNILKGKKMCYPSVNLNFSLNTKDIYDVVSNTFVSTITQLHQKISQSFDNSKEKVSFFSVEDTLLKISTSLYYLHFCYFLLQKELITENVRRSNQKIPEKQISFHFMNEIIHQVSYLLVSVDKLNTLINLQFTMPQKQFSFDTSLFFTEPVEAINKILTFYNNIVKKNYFNNFHSQVSCEHTSYYLSSEPPEMSEKEIMFQLKNQLKDLK